MISPEVVRAQRIARLPFERVSSPCIDGDDDNDESSQDTNNTTSVSIITASSITSNTLSASLSSSMTTNMESPRLGVPPEYTWEGGSDERLVCFGMV